MKREPLAPMELDPELDRRFWNWGRWAQPRFGFGISMTGILCARLAKEVFVFGGEEAPIDVDVRDAVLIESAWRRCTDKKAKTLTHAHYVGRVAYREIAVYLGFRPKRWNYEVTKACLVIACLAKERSL